MIRVLVHGAGRMASRILAKLPEFPDYELLGVVSRTPPVDYTADWFPSMDDINEPVDLLIDFTLPGGTRTAAQWCALNGTALLSGTTGLNDEDVQALQATASSVPVLWAPNLSRGVALTAALVRQAAEALEGNTKISITDIHHVHKLDTPSGTALALSSAAKEGRSRYQHELSAGDEFEPVFSSVREGEVIGEHMVRFTQPDEEIEITHKALSRDVFAMGALKAGEWLLTQNSGFYSARDWLGLG